MRQEIAQTEVKKVIANMRSLLGIPNHSWKYIPSVKFHKRDVGQDSRT